MTMIDTWNESAAAVTGRFDRGIFDDADDAAWLSAPARGWDGVIDQLRAWSEAEVPDDDDGLERPSMRVLRRTALWCKFMRDDGKEPPNRVMMDGVGGISLELRLNKESHYINIDSSGAIELVSYSGAHEVLRKPLVPPFDRPARRR